eukprot:CAMPEP_0195030560 /NCGR_PEP_ID=MMETSP0326_2-20130528/59179_1 /TAXON_ID=2866 ORGANISM="Crypthecodinium cohnii, Strain Seligo" /NCGR_SAMPLE_ID=MMETSP0326_2 /ASSEMBLY_ACC=CAM_ASM_000348 /LENGTH=59 /DNA_ID=CAMNT_0040053897 /DNA_START=44 /DNA_END=223 /DNA_ORIENTATION=+
MAAEDAGADAAEAGAERAESAEAETTAAVSRGDEPRQPIAAPTLLTGLELPAAETAETS